MQLSEAQQYLAYARECLEMAERADTPEQREKLVELSRVWMQAALEQERSWHEHHAEIKTGRKVIASRATSGVPHHGRAATAQL